MTRGKIGTTDIPGAKSYSPPLAPEWAESDSWGEIIMRARRRVRSSESIWGY